MVADYSSVDRPVIQRGSSRDPGSSRPATILQVLPALVTGGVERGTVDIAAAIVEAGGRAVVASAGGPMVHELERAGAHHVTLPLDRRTPWGIRANRKALEALILEWQVDLVHARSRAPAWAALGAARATGRPFVTTFHGTYNFSGRLKRWYNSVMARGDRVIAVSEHIARHIVEAYEVDPARLRVIHRGVDLGVFDPRTVTAERLAALSAAWRVPDGVSVVMLPGRVTRWKGHAVLIEALRRLDRKDVLCLIVGSEQAGTSYRKELDALLQRYDLGCVRFVGECRDMPTAYMLADVVVSASIEPEAFGRVAAEASAMGRPVVATDHGGARETVLDGVTGWLVQPGSAEGLAAGLQAALSMLEAERVELAERARAHVARSFSKPGMAAATLAVYSELLDGAPGR